MAHPFDIWNPRLRAVLRFLFPGEKLIFRGLRVRPIIGSHRNVVSEESFALSPERFGGLETVPIIPLMRRVVDQTLRAYAFSFPYLLKAVGRTPISPHGSMALSVIRWGQVDWDFVRDIDLRIFLPPGLGHLSGFKTDLTNALANELARCGLDLVPLGKDEQGRPQVQLLDLRSGAIHGFHLFLIAMKPGFVRANLHHDGGYSPHFAYFPEGSMDRHLEAAGVGWDAVIDRQVEDYTEMFHQLSFNIFGEDVGMRGRFKTPGWYLRKAFKWYAALARIRGLMSLEEDLLYQYDHFQRSEAEFSYLARHRYYERLAPDQIRRQDLCRDIARVDSVVYAKARNPLDPMVGRVVAGPSGEITLLEMVPKGIEAAARKLLGKELAARAKIRRIILRPSRARYADGPISPIRVQLPDGSDSVLIPSEWSLVFEDCYARQIVKSARNESMTFPKQLISQSAGAIAATLIRQAEDPSAQ